MIRPWVRSGPGKRFLALGDGARRCSVGDDAREPVLEVEYGHPCGAQGCTGHLRVGMPGLGDVGGTAVLAQVAACCLCLLGHHAVDFRDGYLAAQEKDFWRLGLSVDRDGNAGVRAQSTQTQGWALDP
jgi:hypothetical protein